jgi:hypothetical protein
MAYIDRVGYSWDMSNELEIRQLAKRYLDLWERQVAESATDPKAARAMEQWLALLENAGTPITGSSGIAGPVITDRTDD